ncbi:MerR family transcriptional regulator [Vallitalea pronyensis]|uniref:MerR family transcriptional regulator n=1 Tax=Vallitalea pronyensis TaxID=1348613 RepID=A0A8J8MMF5_9FIRM|nr:helix-turn-helix domain-containing protein [Vallitalea pronyensis]QUI24542.1 MerR family transcriptional regulator [Vallitalea pronyensis]
MKKTYDLKYNNAKGEWNVDVHFKIGEIADMYNTSIRALRLYDKMDLFKPEYTDEQTGYRYYTIDQFPVLNTILVFKSIGIRLIDIKKLMENGIDPDELIHLLQQKQAYWENQIEIAKYNLESIENIQSAVGLKCEASDDTPDAYKMSKLVCLENLKVSHLLSEVLWL